MHVSTLSVRTNELEQYSNIERNPKQLRMCRTKRVAKLSALPQSTDVEINDSLADQITSITYDKAIALIRVNCPTPECTDNWVMNVLQAVGACGVACDLVSIQPRQLSFTIHNRLLEEVQGCFEQLECYPEVVTECVRLSIRCIGGQPLLNTITAVTETIAQGNIPLLRLAESYGLIEVLIEARYISEVKRNLEKRFRVQNALNISSFVRI
ncbi:hypothetical protein SAMN04488500_118100 [Sporomusa malonica]|uniref:Uncharacterized protein n=1 Tax=Sporomusa malonica TaxID=112901 RepID=A0A1W2DV81_9FIRM|nr:hypothetical protein SAMN04488500_118100 [Sporomusa malonica]